MSADGGPVRVGALVDALLERRGLRTQIQRLSALDAWEEAVGEGIAEVTAARSVSGGTLFVEVKSSAWMMELDFMKGEILRRVNERAESPVEKLVFVLAGS